MAAPTHPFEEVGDGEPHHIRRQEILKKYPQIKDMDGHDTRTAWVTLAVAVFQMFVAWTHAKAAEEGTFWGSKKAVFFNSWIFGAVFAHWLGQTIHETAHDLAFKNRIHNKMLAFFANLPMILPVCATFHRYHIPHHTYLGVLDRDTDLPHPIEVKYIADYTVPKFAWLLGYFYVYIMRGLTFIKPPKQEEYLNLVVQIIFSAGVYHTMGGVAISYLILSTFFGHSLHPVAAHFIHEHWVFEDGQETNSYYGPLNYVTYNVGYHVEHHDFMNIPGWRLPELHALASEYYKPLKSHNSWAYVHYHFITSSFCHVGNRMVRTLETFRKSRVRLAPGSGKLPIGRGLLSPKIMGPVPTESTKMD